ncbi:hypothetical protein [Streptomyces sp. NRRL F-5135]|uniref:hypothetical protein n=1 Tax=Streptomyces sp. NRRL F-5135 TaxID=1463858 RepID=UPI0004C6AB98|nr:hypothetical protein [Streptomyces sp. NRRL F-5135]
MRPPRRPAAAATAAVLIVTGLAVSAEIRAMTGSAAPAEGREAALDDREAGHVRDDRFRATCRTRVQGSQAGVSCHNPYPSTDRIRLHIECARWWDIDVDSAPAEVRPAGYAELTGRCWKEIRAVWVTHEGAES